MLVDIRKGVTFGGSRVTRGMKGFLGGNISFLDLDLWVCSLSENVSYTFLICILYINI